MLGADFNLATFGQCAPSCGSGGTPDTSVFSLMDDSYHLATVCLHASEEAVAADFKGQGEAMWLSPKR